MLHEILRSHPDFAVTVLVRDQAKADRIVKAYPSVKTAIGDLDSAELLEEAASKAHVVLSMLNHRAIGIRLTLCRLGCIQAHWCHGSDPPRSKKDHDKRTG